MTSTTSINADRFAQVSSLYGPGTVAGWYFTILSVLVSWTLHPRKWKSGSIDMNLVAILTLPAVAAGHIIWQGQSLHNQMAEVSDEALIQLIAALEAPFIVTETFMAVSVILFLVAAWTYCIRRAILVALIGLECFAIEIFAHIYIRLYRYRPGTLARNSPAFSRLFVADFIGLLIAIIAVLGLLVVITGLVILLIHFNSKKESPSPEHGIESSSYPRENLSAKGSVGHGIAVAHSVTPSEARAITARSLAAVQTRPLNPWRSRFRRLESYRDRALEPFTLLSTLLLPLSFIATLLPAFWHSTSYFTVSAIELPFWDRVKDFAFRFGRDFFPRTACSITDLDQAVAAVAGATALAFSIYSVAKAYYKICKMTGNRPDNEISGSTPAIFELGPLEEPTRRRSLYLYVSTYRARTVSQTVVTTEKSCPLLKAES